MIVAIFIVAAKLRLTENQEIQLPRTRDFSVALRGRVENLFPHMHVYVMDILIYMSEKMVSVTPSVLCPHNGGGRILEAATLIVVSTAAMPRGAYDEEEKFINGGISSMGGSASPLPSNRTRFSGRSNSFIFIYSLFGVPNLRVVFWQAFQSARRVCSTALPSHFGATFERNRHESRIMVRFYPFVLAFYVLTSPSKRTTLIDF
jgi:hypothetical protein